MKLEIFISKLLTAFGNFFHYRSQTDSFQDVFDALTAVNKKQGLLSGSNLVLAFSNLIKKLRAELSILSSVKVCFDNLLIGDDR